MRLEDVRFVGKIKEFPELSISALCRIIETDNTHEMKKYTPCCELKTIDKCYLLNMVNYFFSTPIDKFSKSRLNRTDSCKCYECSAEYQRSYPEPIY